MIDIDSTGTPVQVTDLDTDWLLWLVEDAAAQARAVEARKLRLAVEWCLRHPAAPGDDVEALGAEGTPLVEEFAAEPLGAALQITTHAALALMIDALELHYRHPRIWARVQACEVPAWRARRIAQATHHLTADQAAAVDADLVGRAATCGTVLIDRAVTQAVADLDPATQHDAEAHRQALWDVRLFHGPEEGPGRWVGTSTLQITGDTVELTRLYDQINTTAVDLGKAGDDSPLETRRAKAVGLLSRTMGDGRPPRVRLYLHADLADLTEPTIGTGSVERLGPLTTATIKDWVGHAGVTVLPVLREDRTDAVDQHDPPAWMRELVILRDQHCVFPLCATDARSCDLDHIEEYVPPGQTHPGNLAPLCRRHHRAKTKRRWRYHRDPDGSYHWSGPHHRRYLVGRSGTLQLP
jgi:hypothetical protein